MWISSGTLVFSATILPLFYKTHKFYDQGAILWWKKPESSQILPLCLKTSKCYDQGNIMVRKARVSGKIHIMSTIYHSVFIGYDILIGILQSMSAKLVLKSLMTVRSD